MIRYCPKCQKDETRSECKYGTGFWDMFSVPSALTPNQMKYDPNRPHPANEEKDHEYSMARSELSTIMTAAKRLKKKVGKGEGGLEAWVQSKITKAADYIDTAADYLDSGQGKVDEACWDGYEQQGMKKKGKKVVPNCVKKEEFSNWRNELEELDENPLIGLGIRAGLAAGTALAGMALANKAKQVGEKIKERNKKTEDAIRQLNQSYELENELVEYSNWREEIGLSEDWQKVNRQDKTDGLSQKAVNAYRRENPGSKLQTEIGRAHV